MRNRELHDSLREFALEAASQLTTDVEAGAEIPYDVIEEPGSGSVLYRYVPLTREFIAERWDVLRAAPAGAAAADALGTGAELYLRVRGEPYADDAEPALRAMLERLYEDATDFHFPEERFERVYAEVERTLYQDTVRSSVVAPIHGLALESDRVELGGGLVLAAGDRFAAPPQAVWPSGREEREGGAGPNAVVALERDEETANPLPASEARVRFRRLVTALRLFKAGRVSIGSVGWGRADEGAWQTVPLAPSGPGRGEPWVLAESEEAELRELCELLSSAPGAARVRWALTRFEMGCERSSDTEALSDYLLALESLLDASDETGRASLGLRLAALCAEEHERKATRARLEAAFALERALMAGSGLDAAIDDGEGEVPAPALVAELEGHARALLRDIVCGYLSPDLRSVADDVLLASSEPLDITAQDLREEDEEDQDGDNGEHEVEEGDHHVPDGPGTAADPRSAAWAIAMAAGPRTRREPARRFEESSESETVDGAADQDLTMEGPIPTDDPDPETEAEEQQQLDTGVTPSTDWEFDDDPASYSAPI